jgi:hypothetical protein
VAIPLAKKKITADAKITPEPKTFKNSQFVTEIPFQYIFYEWAFFVVGIGVIIFAITDLIKWIKQ